MVREYFVQSKLLKYLRQAISSHFWTQKYCLPTVIFFLETNPRLKNQFLSAKCFEKCFKLKAGLVTKMVMVGDYWKAQNAVLLLN